MAAGGRDRVHSPTLLVMKAQGPCSHPRAKPVATGSGDLNKACYSRPPCQLFTGSSVALPQGERIVGGHLAPQLHYTSWPSVQLGQVLASGMSAKVICAPRQSLGDNGPTFSLPTPTLSTMRLRPSFTHEDVYNTSGNGREARWKVPEFPNDRMRRSIHPKLLQKREGNFFVF